MQSTTWNDRFRNGFIYALMTTVLLLGAGSALASIAGKEQQKLADRVDRNTAAIVCILQLGVDSHAPPRSDENVQLCLADPAWVDGETPSP
jgi:hypothetical protein